MGIRVLSLSLSLSLFSHVSRNCGIISSINITTKTKQRNKQKNNYKISYVNPNSSKAKFENNKTKQKSFKKNNNKSSKCQKNIIFETIEGSEIPSSCNSIITSLGKGGGSYFQ